MGKRWILAVLFVLAAVPLAAVDGVLEINQACVATGCFPGDAPGFPVEIPASGSYRLTSNLTVPDADTTAIEFTADDVSVDLNGFALQGPTSCDPPPCTPTGGGSGVYAPGANRVVVKNGAVRGFGSIGVYVGNGSRVAGVHMSHNGFAGMVAGTGSVVVQNTVTYNFIGLGAEGVVVENTVLRNLQEGIVVFGRGSTVTTNTISENSQEGIRFAIVAGYGGNVIEGNNGGNANPQVSGPGIEIATNICGTDTTCP